MARNRFGKGKAKAAAEKKTQLKDTIRRVPVAKPRARPKGSKNKTEVPAAIAIA
jgi:hypothetical protein